MRAVFLNIAPSCRKVVVSSTMPPGGAMQVREIELWCQAAVVSAQGKLRKRFEICRGQRHTPARDARMRQLCSSARGCVPALAADDALRNETRRQDSTCVARAFPAISLRCMRCRAGASITSLAVQNSKIKRRRRLLHHRLLEAFLPQLPKRRAADAGAITRIARRCPTTQLAP